MVNLRTFGGEKVNLIKGIFLIVILSLISMPASSEDHAGRITEISGKVYYRERNNIPYVSAKKNIGLKKGYWIKTGDDGWAIITLNDKSRITLANNTELEITDYLLKDNTRRGVFSLAQGKLRASVVKLAGEKVDYSVKSPTAVAGIKGTEFMMLTNGVANVFFGNEGSLEVRGDTELARPLGVDTMVQNTRGYTPTEPVKVEPGTPLATAQKNFKEITSTKPPEDWEVSNNLPHIIARWNINYGHYLADAGRYEEALYVFQIAIDLTNMPEIRSDARLERGTVFSRFLRNPEAALAEYLLILEEYPQVPQRENALYLTAMTLYEIGFHEKAKERFMQYKKEYPSGKYINNVETLLNILNNTGR